MKQITDRYYAETERGKHWVISIFKGQAYYVGKPHKSLDAAKRTANKLQSK